uniref:Nicastrin n=1 Tax=Electrophorus electricus TaxID=8005 RepID=A0A4W4GB17_ELEEL
MICCVQVLLRVKPSVNSLYLDVSGSSVEQKIYIELKNTVPCVRLLNATHQIGCQSSISGDTGVLHVLETEADLDWILSTGPHPPYMVLMEATFFTRPTMMRMKNSTRVAGVAVINSNTTAVESFSPHTSCPNQNTGVYREDYGPDLANCSSTVWNPLGNSMSYEDFTFPIFSLKDDNQTQVMRKCYEDHNMRVNGSAPQYPLCAMQLFSHMHAVTDTVTCMRRAEVCDPLSDFNVWASIRPINASAKGHKNNESVVIAAARLDGRSFFWDIGTSAEGTVSGIVTLLAAAHALYPVTQEAPPVRNIFFTFFQGETFDYIGSSRMVYDMKQDKFVINLDNVHSVLEIGQVCTTTFPLFQVINLVDNIKSVASTLNVSLDEPNTTQALPPSSFQRFLRVQPIPGVVLADHKSSFINRYYESLYDTAAYLNMTYPSDLSPEEQMEYETEASKSLTEVATLVARSLYKQAGGNDRLLINITADAKMVSLHMLLYGFLVRSNNSWFITLPSLLSPESGPPQYYIGLRQDNSVKSVTRFVQFVMANATGTVTSLNQIQCQNPNDVPGESKDLYSYHWVSGPPSANSTEGDPYCVRTSVRLAKALSPAFELPEYGSREYSTWTESRWKTIRARIFLVASPQLEVMVLLGFRCRLDEV